MAMKKYEKVGNLLLRQMSVVPGRKRMHNHAIALLIAVATFVAVILGEVPSQDERNVCWPQATLTNFLYFNSGPF
eukprot:790636-Amphidinium_carterae.1